MFSIQIVSSDKRLDTRNAARSIYHRDIFRKQIRERRGARFRNALIFHPCAESPLYPAQKDPADQWRHSSTLEGHSHFLPPQKSLRCRRCLSPMRYVGVTIIREMSGGSMDVANWEKTRDVVALQKLDAIKRSRGKNNRFSFFFFF